MRTLFIECNAGAAGDMLMSALSEIHPDPAGFIEKFNTIGIPDVVLKYGKAEQNGIVGTHLHVLVNNKEEDEHMHEHHHEHEHNHEHERGHEHEHEHEHHHHSHTHLSDIKTLIESLDINENVKKNAVSVYTLLARAEAHVHGKEIDNIHFHEVGTMDAVADIVGVCMLIDELAPDKIIASPVNVGGGFVKCAHGILPVPAPATEQLLYGIPYYGSGNEGERCTPTGAALLKHFVSDFGEMPLMTVERSGYGAGTKHFSTANILRVFLGETPDKTDEIYELNCNIDDMTGEDIAFACEMLFKAGARDVFTTPIYMKKGRPAVLLSCICTNDKKDGIVKAIFKHTTTLGIREKKCERYILERSEDPIATKYGEIGVKTASGYGVSRRKAEFEDIKKAAEVSGLSLDEIRRETGL